MTAKNAPVVVPELLSMGEALAACIGALRGIADGMEKAGQAPITCESLRGIANAAYAVLERANGGAA